MAISASVFEDDRKQSLEAGCDDFMPKPFVADQLLAKIQKLLNLTWIFDEESPLISLHHQRITLSTTLELLIKILWANPRTTFIE